MPPGPTIHYGDHDFRFGQLRFARVHIYPSLASLNADAAFAVARIVYVQENQTYYVGKPGAWVELGAGGGGGGGGGGGSVPDPADLDHQYPDVVGNVLNADAALSQFTLDFTPGDLDHLQAGDALVISGSQDSGAVNWLDGSYDILAVNPGTGVIDVVPGSIPTIPTPPEVTFGTYAAVDQTFPSDGSLAVVNPDPDTGEPALWIYDAGDSSWHNANTLDTRLVFRDGSRLLSGWLALVPSLTSLPPTTQSLVTRNYIECLLLGYSTGRHAITSIASAGTTVVVFPTTDQAAVLAAVGQQLVIAGTATAADGTHTISAASWLANVATITIPANGVNVVGPTGTVAIRVPNAALADEADVAVVAAALAAHIAAVDPHPQYTTTAEATALAAAAVATHVADPDPHPALPTVGEATAIADAAVTAHDTDPNAHGGALEAAAAATKGGVIAQGQAIHPSCSYGMPVVLDANQLMWKPRGGAAVKPQGMAVGVEGKSTVITGVYDDINVEAISASVLEVDPDIAGRFRVGRFYRFPDLAVNSALWFRIIAVDEVTGELTVEPDATIAAVDNSSVSELLPDGQVAIVGLIELSNSRVVSGSYDAVVADLDNNRVTLDGDLRLELPEGDLVLVLSGTAANDGSYPVLSYDPILKRVHLRPAPSKLIDTLTVESIDVSSQQFEFDAGDDLTGILTGDRLTPTGTTDNDGVYTVVNVDDALKLITVAEPLPGTDQAAPAGTATAHAINRLSPLAAIYPPEVTYLTGSIQAIDVDNGSGQAEVTFDAGDDLSTILPGDRLAISGATDPLTNVSDREVLSADNGTKVLTLVNTLPGADQAAPAGTGVVTGFHPGVDGAAVFQRPSATAFPFDTSIATFPGPTFYTDPLDAVDISKTGSRFTVGVQASLDQFKLSITDLLDGAVQSFATTGTVLSSRRAVILLDATAGTFTLTLAPGVDGDELFITETSGLNLVTIDGDGGETVEGAATANIAAAGGRHYVFRSGNWARLFA